MSACLASVCAIFGEIPARDRDDQTAKELVKDPVGAYVEQVYEYADFSQLGIGG